MVIFDDLSKVRDRLLKDLEKETNEQERKILALAVCIIDSILEKRRSPRD
jgi:hypothetical protein